MADFTIKRGDLLPAIEATITYSDGTAVNLAGATVKFLMADAASTLKVDAGATIVDAAAGEVKYSWSGTDTDTIGTYRAEFEATFSGSPMTAPNTTYLEVRIIADLG